MTRPVISNLDAKKGVSASFDLAHRIIEYALPELASATDLATALSALTYAQGALICSIATTEEGRLEGAELANERLIAFVTKQQPGEPN